ncbi:two-component system activity regulator YycH, partial [Bacillus sp. WP8]|uniref:two-component system activity regulator YycH n=1 Tax=Bacillus sp. WP8 TaxID=756828 RepID=UPI0028D5187B
MQYHHPNINSTTLFQTPDFINRTLKYFNDTPTFTHHYQYFPINTNHHLSFNIFIHPLPILNTTNHPFPITSLQLQSPNHHI